MKRSYRLAWLLILAGACAGAAWISFGRAYARRRTFGAPVFPEASRASSQFVAVLLPRVTAGSGKYAMSAAELKQFLTLLKGEGSVFVGLQDIADFYGRGRPLPPHAVLLAFAQDDPQGLDAADGVLMRLRLRGTAFITRTDAPEDQGQRRFLNRHAVEQMKLGGTWDFGLLAQETPPSIPEAGRILAMLDDGAGRRAPKAAAAPPLGFTISELGLNDRADDPRALRVLAIRPGRAPRENLLVVRAAWPRAAEFVDDFREDGLGADWIPGGGSADRGRGRLALLPTPRQSGAGVYLRGTEKWRDVVLDFGLKRFQKEFWAYARDNADGSYVRFGANGDSWYAEQKTGARSLPTQLARAPILSGDLPARVRLVLKDGALLAFVNGRMLFGRLLRVNPAVDRGRVHFGVYDPKTRSSMAVLTAVRAAPLAEEWLAPDNGSSREFDEERLGDLRAEAVLARGLSPRWIQIAPDGGVAAAETQGVLLRSLAGFYGCRILPAAELPPGAGFVLGRAASAEKTAAGLAEAVRKLDASGLNLRLRRGDAERPETIAFLKRLREEFHSRRWELWVTVDGVHPSDAVAAQSADGMLRPSERGKTGLEVLEAAASVPAAPSRTEARVTATKRKRQTPLQTASRTQWEPASIQ